MNNIGRTQNIIQRSLTFFGCIVFFFGCDAPPPQASLNKRPTRIVSLDYCADQYVLKLADKSQILALSPDAEKDYSYMRNTAVGLSTVPPVAENVLALKPDLIVRSYGGGANAASFFQRAGIPVLQIAWATHIDGENAGSIAATTRQVAKEFGHAQRGDELVASFKNRLFALRSRAYKEQVLYITPAGITAGPDTLIHAALTLAGFQNFVVKSGWQPVPLESIAYAEPDLIAAAFFETFQHYPDPWSAVRHPLIRTQLTNNKVVPLQSAWIACGAWFISDAMEALIDGAEK